MAGELNRESSDRAGEEGSKSDSIQEDLDDSNLPLSGNEVSLRASQDTSILQTERNGVDHLRELRR